MVARIFMEEALTFSSLDGQNTSISDIRFVRIMNNACYSLTHRLLTESIVWYQKQLNRGVKKLCQNNFPRGSFTQASYFQISHFPNHAQNKVGV